ncbi:hypothetical protein GCM10010443_23790 [Actinoplanes cyaneus]|uniref:LamG-like jellyroll fold domain-containing protein n=1 Tax=Actinoplanes cyaneus TaxID=52696 RepID=UPI0031DF1892
MSHHWRHRSVHRRTGHLFPATGRALAAALAVALAVVMSDNVLPPAARADSAAAPPAAGAKLERPDELSALATARTTGKPVTITGKTTATSEFVALPSGSIELTTYTAPVRVRRGDDWVPVDLTLHRATDGSISPAAHPEGLRITGRRSATSGALATLGAGDRQVAMGWAGALPEPELSGNTATYAEVLPQVDLVVEATRTGFEQFVVVKSRAAARRVASLSLPITGPSVASQKRDATGALVLADAKGRTIVTAPTPLMWDATTSADGETPQRRAVVRSSARKRPAAAGRHAGVDLTLTPDLAWIDDPATTFPVTIDPALAVATTFDTYVKDGDSADHGGANDLQLGLLSGTGGKRTRSFVTWDTTALRGKQITSATAQFYNWYSTTCTATSWEIWSTGATTSDTRWANQPAWSAREATSTQTKGFSSSCSDGWVSITATSFFQRAATANATRGYMGIRATDETSTSAFKQFRSRNAADNAQVPKATVTYNSIPVVGTRSTTPATSCATGTSRPYLASRTPALKAAASDSDGTAQKVTFEWWPAGGTAKIGSATVSVASGATASTTVPAGAFAENGTYSWRVNTSDGTTTSAWSPFCEFTVDTTAPGTAPAVSSTSYPAGTWSGAPGTAGTFTLSAVGVADVKSYVYGLDTNPPATTKAAAALGAAVDVPVTPATAGPHTLYVQSVDRAGNKSPLTSYAFSVGAAAVLSPSEGATSAGLTRLQGSAPPSVTGATFQWRRADTDAWVNVPAGDVRSAAGGTAVNWPVAMSGGTSAALNWNVRQTLANANSPASLTGRWWLNETSGSTAADSSGKAHDATTSGGVTWSGDHGGSAVLNGADGYIRTNAPVIDTTGSFTVSAWVNLTDTSDHRVLLSQSGTRQASFAIQYEKDAKRWELIRWGQDVDDPAQAYTVDSLAEPRLNSWTHLAAVFDKTTSSMQLYVDGVLQGGATFATPIAGNGPLLIGSAIWNAAPAAFWKGGIADVQAYTAALSGAQVATIAQGGQAVNTSAPLTGPLQVRAVYTGSTSSNSAPTHFVFDPAQADAEAGKVGPGDVNLLTGNLEVTEADAAIDSYAAQLSVSRTFNSRSARDFDNTHMFGPGWTSSAVVDTTGLLYGGLTVSGSLVQVTRTEDGILGFTQAATAGGVTSFTPQVGEEDLSLTYTAATNTYVLSTRGGVKVTFTAAGVAGRYAPTRVDQPGVAQSTTMSWEAATVDGVGVVRPTKVLAPLPGGVTCTTPAAGCRLLTFTYATATTATATARGDYAGRLSKVSFTAFDPATSAMRTVDLSAYQYDAGGRLAAQWDPRLDNGTTHLQTVYTYHADGTLASAGPDATRAWTFAYTTVPGDLGAGRLASASRTALTAGTATTTVVYRLPLSGTGAPYQLSTAQTLRWGQTEAPVYATAIFDPGQIPAGNQAGGVLPTSWTRATVTYLDANGRVVDTVTPGGHTTATWYDAYGNETRSLTAANLAAALTASSSDTAAQEAALAEAVSTVTVYSADGLTELSTVGPAHQVTLADGAVVTGRSVVLTSSDQNAAAPCPCGLTTTQRTGTQYVDANGATVNADLVTKTTAYDWDLRKDVTVTTDPGAAPHLNLVERTSYDDAGLVTSLTRPGGGGSDTTAYTTRTTYYRAGTGSGHTECDSRPEWANLVCRTDPAGQPASGPALPATVATYNYYLQEATVTERTAAGVLRTTTTTYDGAERVATIAVTGSTGQPVSTTRSVFDPATGHIAQVQAVGADNTVLARTTVGVDGLDRDSSYLDADGAASTVGYDLLGRIQTRSGTLGTRTYTFDQNGEARGLPTQVVDSRAGTFTATYDPDGRVVTETWPTGITVTHTYDAVGETGVTYTKPGCGLSDCTLYSQSRTAGSNGQPAATVSPFSGEAYTYDAAARLTAVQDTQHSTCTTRTYRFNAAGDRTGLTTYAPGQDDGCQTATADTARTWTYDTADRITNAGYQYDVLGNATAIPAEDTQTAETGPVTLGYYVNGRIRSITQNGTSTAYELDAGNERVRSWTDPQGVTHVNHYTAAGQRDAAWTDEGDGNRTMPVAGLSGIAGTVTVGATTDVAWRLSDLDGDLVATVAGADTAVSAFTLTDEYGTLEDSSQAGAVRYAWLGERQHAADNPGGLVSMGSRVYNPATGSFTADDPIPGGGVSRYGYCGGDPLGCRDTSGEGECSGWGIFKICGKVTNNWISDKPGEIAHHRNSRGKPSTTNGQNFCRLKPAKHSWKAPCSFKDTDLLCNKGKWKIVHDDEHLPMYVRKQDRGWCSHMTK